MQENMIYYIQGNKGILLFFLKQARKQITFRFCEIQGFKKQGQEY